MIFRYYPQIHLTPIFEIKVHEKKFLDTKKKIIFEARFSLLNIYINKVTHNIIRAELA